MPSRISVAAVASIATLAFATGCEKQNPYVTLTAGGVVVKAQAIEYCRGDDCRVTQDVPRLKVAPGDTLGIDVPRSLAEQGWRLVNPQRQEPPEQQGPLLYDHYRGIPLPGGFSGPIEIQRDANHGKGIWRFMLVAEQ